MASTISFLAVTDGDQDSVSKIRVDQPLVDVNTLGADDPNPNLYRIAHSFLEFSSMLGSDMYSSYDAFLKMFMLKFNQLEELGDDPEGMAELLSELRKITTSVMGVQLDSLRKSNVQIPSDVEKFQEQIAGSKTFAKRVMSVFLDDLKT